MIKMSGEPSVEPKITHRIRKLDHPATDEERVLAALAGECLQWTRHDDLGHRWVCHTLPCPNDL